MIEDNGDIFGMTDEDRASFARLSDPATRNEEIARIEAESAAMRAEQEAQREAARAERESLDDDYHALQFSLWFEVIGIPGYDEPLESGSYIDLSELSDDDDHNACVAEALESEINSALGQWSAHYRDMGMLRADNLLYTLARA